MLVPHLEHHVPDAVGHAQRHWLRYRGQAPTEDGVRPKDGAAPVHERWTINRRPGDSGMPAAGALPDALAGMTGAPCPTGPTGQVPLPSGPPPGW